jgi:hypothetical protein
VKHGRRVPSEIRLLASRGHPFWSVVHIATDDTACWPWDGAVDRDVWVRGARSSAPHRLGTRDGQDLHGGQVVRHACDSALCCNPRHLIAAPIADGIATRVQKNQSARGAFNGRAQLSNSQVLGIYTARGTYAEIGRRFGVSTAAVSASGHGVLVVRLAFTPPVLSLHLPSSPRAGAIERCAPQKRHPANARYAPA